MANLYIHSCELLEDLVGVMLVKSYPQNHNVLEMLSWQLSFHFADARKMEKTDYNRGM